MYLPDVTDRYRYLPNVGGSAAAAMITRPADGCNRMLG
jgi:hypothetical protein